SADHTVDSFGDQADIELEQRTLSLSGAVTDSNGDPLDGATVTLTTDAGQELTDTSVAGGDYAIEEVPIGTHDVEVTLDGYATATESVEFGEEDVTEDYELEAFGSIEGVVRDADDGSGLNGAELTLVDADGNEVDTVTSDSDGSYAFDSVAPGEYTIDAERGGTEDASADVTVEPGATTERDVEMTVTG
ncbi:hypothetical protein DQW50_03770, partial [Halorubrum sp. 48-1-W]|uniref:carboxypeptidase-like regulatory domain-containing protein n=1 Tax=Halorubrum sp. 48-1-W TaxID=2249761 RepID=UPI000DCE1233